MENSPLLQSDTEPAPNYGSLEKNNEDSPYVDKAETNMLQISQKLIINSLPNVIHHLLIFILPTMGIYFISKSGDQTLIAGIGLAYTWIYTTTLFPIDNLNMGTLVFSAAAYGAQQYRLCGLYYHRGVILRLLGLIPSYCLLLLSYTIFVNLGVSEDISLAAFTFAAYTLPYLIILAFFNTTKYYAISQNVNTPIFIIQAIVTCSHLIGCEIFVIHLQLGLKGVAYSLALSHLIGLILLFVYMSQSEKFKQTFFLLEKESFRGLLQQLKNECFIAAPTYMEWMVYEVYTLIAAANFNENQLVAWVVLYNIMAISYMIPLGLGMCTAVEVGNSFGDRDLQRGKTTMRASLYLSIISILIEIVLLYIFKKPFINLYDDDAEVYNIAVVILEMYLIILPAEFLQIIIMSILKVIGKEKLATVLFFIAHYLIGMSTGFTLGVLKGMECRGILYGMAVGMYFLFIFSAGALYTTDMPRQVEIIQKRIEASRADIAKLSDTSHENSRLLLSPMVTVF